MDTRIGVHSKVWLFINFSDMRIAEVSKQTGLSRDTIRWYEKIGLITLDKKARDGNNYRKFDQKALDRLLLIKGVKSFGFTLKEVAGLLFLDDANDLNCDSASGIYNSKLEAIDERINELQKLKTKLVHARDCCSGNCKELFGKV